MKYNAFTGIIILLFVIEVCAQQNPFLGSTNKTSEKIVENKEKQKTSKTISEHIWLRLPFSKKILSLQRDLTNKFSSYFRSIKEQPKISTILGLLLLAMIYGIIHSIGPGHAKLLFVSHTLVNPTPVLNIMLAGLLFSLIHTGTSLLLFLFLKLLLGFGQSTIETYSQKMINISGVLLIIAGILTFFSSKLENIAESSINKYIKGVSSICCIAIIAGIAPCPGTFLLLTFSNILGIFYIGILSVVAVSIGMAFTVSMAGSAGGLFASQVTQNKHSKYGKYLKSTFRYAGSGLIVIMGLFMLLR